MDEEKKNNIRMGVIRKLREEGKFTGKYVKTQKICERCNKDYKPKRSDQRFCSLKCVNILKTDEEKRKLNVLRVSNARRTIKKHGIEYLGGKCNECGYKKYIGALHFHHKDESLKSFSVSSRGLTRSWDKLRPELDKCIILCSNCHMELHHK